MINRDNFSYFSFKPYGVTPHLNRLEETIQMRGHNICLYAELTKIIPDYHQITSLILSSGCYSVVTQTRLTFKHAISCIL